MIKKGEIVYGRITNILGYGAFVKVGEYDGLIHISEFSDNYVRQIKDYVIIGQHVKLKVLDVDEENKNSNSAIDSIHRRRGVKSKVPKFIIGFKSLEKQIPVFIDEQLKKLKLLESKNK